LVSVAGALYLSSFIARSGKFTNSALNRKE
jgi:hypothetical protein